MRNASKLIRAVVVNAMLLLGAGCVITGRPPPDLAHVSITTVDSPFVTLDHVRLVRDSGGLFITGHVFKRPVPADTASTHLDVTWRDSTGQALGTVAGDFTPRNLVRRGPRPAVGSFRIRLANSPAMLHQIEVRAHAEPCRFYLDPIVPLDSADPTHENPPASSDV